MEARVRFEFKTMRYIIEVYITSFDKQPILKWYDIGKKYIDKNEAQKYLSKIKRIGSQNPTIDELKELNII